MSEIFTIAIKNVAVSVLQDLLAAYASSTNKLQLLAVEVAANGQTTVGNYPLSIKRLPATVTLGVGGSTLTPYNVNPGGASPTFVAHGNDTTQATSSASIVTLVGTQFNPINGYYWQPPVPVSDEPKAQLSEALILSLDANPTAPIAVSATMWLREV